MRPGTGFEIHPFVGFVREGFELKIDKSEVAEAFEVPLAFLMDPAKSRAAHVDVARPRAALLRHDV